MVDIITDIQSLNWDGIGPSEDNEAIPETDYHVNTYKDGKDYSVVPNAEEIMGLVLEADKPEDVRAMDYTLDDERIKALIAEMYDEKAEEMEDEQEGSDFEEMIYEAIGYQNMHDNRFNILSIDGSEINRDFSRATEVSTTTINFFDDRRGGNAKTI